ncbi:MAG TPA: hypothetical protein VGK73_00120, partial [Polyangiaceae bacterium]
MALRFVLSLVLLLACAACRRETRPPDRTEPWLASASVSASSSAGPALPRRVRYALARSRVEFELPARQATPRGRLSPTRGELEVDLANPSGTTGRIELDLSSLELFESDGTTPSPTFTARALDWLELGKRTSEERREVGRIATFSLRSLGGPADRARPPDDRGLRSGDWSVRGDLGLHGVRTPLEAAISVSVPAADDETAPPRELVIRSRRPLVISLGTHDIRPRDDSGVLLPRENSLLGDRVGREVRVS